ncbi:MAG: hypothetical protein ACRDV9_10150 [Acidimicrobiia bacterium]
MAEPRVAQTPVATVVTGVSWSRQPGGLGQEMAAELEAFIEHDALLDPPSLVEVVARIEGEAGHDGAPVLFELAQLFRGLLARLDLEPLTLGAQRDLEAALYPRLWKILEAAQEELPAAEQRIRAQVTNRRLARMLAAEAAGQEQP